MRYRGPDERNRAEKIRFQNRLDIVIRQLFRSAEKTVAGVGAKAAFTVPITVPPEAGNLVPEAA